MTSIFVWITVGILYFVLGFYFMGRLWKEWECDKTPPWDTETCAGFVLLTFICGVFWILVIPARVAWIRGFLRK